ncbi:MAG: hypothetical protein Q8K31_05430 [Burkholderiaceae bacterium]|nr:hypothetical protein [Burkholderiaceae bacterium]
MNTQRYAKLFKEACQELDIQPPPDETGTVQPEGGCGLISINGATVALYYDEALGAELLQIRVECQTLPPPQSADIFRVLLAYNFEFGSCGHAIFGVLPGQNGADQVFLTLQCSLDGVDSGAALADLLRNATHQAKTLWTQVAEPEAPPEPRANLPVHFA